MNGITIAILEITAELEISISHFFFVVVLLAQFVVIALLRVTHAADLMLPLFSSFQSFLRVFFFYI